MRETRDIGASVEGWRPPPRPGRLTLDGRYVRLEPLSPDAHAAQLFKSNSTSDRIWDFLPYGPFTSASAYHRWMRDATVGDDPGFLAIFNRDSGQWEGVASYLRIQPEAGSIEVGHINFSPALARYRRYEWKCDARNLASRRAAERLGLSYEGTFRQAAVIKGRNRDTAWFAAIDAEWPALKEAFLAWLAPANFDAAGRQRERLGDLTRLVRVADDPALRD